MCSRCGTMLQASKAVPALGYIRNVTARQIWPHKKIEICYEIADDIGDLLLDSDNTPIVLTSSYGAKTNTATKIYGNASCAPGRHVVAWDCEADSVSINQANVTFTVTFGGSGLSVKYYNISSSGYSTWISSETSMLDYFASKTPTIATNTLAWGSGLSAGFTKLYSERQNLIINAGMTLESDGCRYHGKYALADTDYFATFFDGYIQVDKAGTYSFKGFADDYFVLYIDGVRICNAQFPSIGEGSYSLSAGIHRISGATYETGNEHGATIQWKKPGDSGYTPIPQSVLFNKVNKKEVSSVSGVAVNTSSSVADGMSVSGPMNLDYSPFADGEVTLSIDGVAVLSSVHSGSFAWMPQTVGTHTLVHKSGSCIWSRKVNVKTLVWATDSVPNPPTSKDSKISISSTSKSFATGGGSGSIVTSGSGTWSASVSDDWITIPPSLTSRNAGLPVVYQVSANSGVEPRTGYVYVSGHVFTITQAGVGAKLDISTADFETEGGTGSFTVLADAQSSWKAKPNVAWLSVVATTGTGESSVSYTVAPFNEVSTRSGTITAAGCTFTVKQTGRRMKIAGGTIESGVSGLSAAYDYKSHVMDIQVNALASTIWSVEPKASWISVVDAGSGRGGDNVALAINENPSYLARRGTVQIGTETLTIRQAGRPLSALSFSISPTIASASVKGANAIIAVTATPDLPWTATSQANWLTVMPTFQSGSGNGNAIYSASPNPTMAARSGTIRIVAEVGASKTHTVNQPAATAMVSATSHTFAATGESFPVEVTVDDVVNWFVSSSSSWVVAQGDASRYGPGTVTVAARENLTVEPREADLTIAGYKFHAVQLGRSVEVEYETRVFGPETDYATLDIHPDGNVTWTAVSSDPTWLTIWGGEGCSVDDQGNVIGTGDNTIEYIVADYVGDGMPRTGTITIGDKTVYVTQRGYDLSIDPTGTNVAGNAGSGTIGVSASVGEIWNAIATESWITIASGCSEGSGSGTVRFTYTENDTGAERVGKIVIAGEAYTITQAARQMATISTRIEGGKGVVAGAGTYNRGTTVTLSAVASDGYAFVTWGLPDGSTATGGSLSVTADADKEIIATFRRIPYYGVNGESVLEGTSLTFSAPADIVDDAGTTKLVCTGTSRFPDKGTNFTLVVTEDIEFEWDLWQTNYLVTVTQPSGGKILKDGRQSSASLWMAAGYTLTLTAKPDSGKSLLRWTIAEERQTSAFVLASVDGTPAMPLQRTINEPLAVSAIFGTPDDTLATASDAPMFVFTTGGDAEWMPVIDATAQAGYTSLRSGDVGANSDTWLDTTVEGSGTLSFRWRVDCEKDDGGEATWDRLAVFVNGVEAARIDGTTGWETISLPISGKTAIRWSFYRDDWDDPDQTHANAGWIDGVTFTEGL